MSVVLTPTSTTVDRTGPTWLMEWRGYELLVQLAPAALVPSALPEPALRQPVFTQPLVARSGLLPPAFPGSAAPVRGRAEVQIGIPRTAQSLEQMVLIKRFHSDVPEADWVQLVAELEFASWLRHDNLVRTLGIGLEAGRYFLITEFLEGATLRACLDWSAATSTRLGNAVVARILLAILEAVKYANAVARSGQSQALAWAPVAADEVFITYDGQVKLLGFKSTHGRNGATGVASGPSAIDALLEQQLTPELRRVLARWARAANDTGSDPAEELRTAFCPPGGAALDDIGRAELSSLMRHVQRNERAAQALRLAQAFAQLRGPVRRSSALTGEEEAPPQSGLRRIAARDLDTAETFGLVRPVQRS